MRVLRLGSSIDSEGETPPEERATAIAAALLEAACGEPVETILRVPWPGPAMAETVERWVEEFRPDFVCFNVSSHWCESEVLALRLREFGPIGRWVAGILDRNTKNYAFNANPLVRLGRKLAASTIGGRPPFAPAAAAASIEATLRRIVRHEHVAVVLAGSPYSAALDGGGGARRRARDRRARLFRLLAAACEPLHIPYELPAHDADAFSKAIRTRDRLHFGPEMHRRCGEIQGRLLVAAWQAQTLPRASGS